MYLYLEETKELFLVNFLWMATYTKIHQSWRPRIYLLWYLSPFYPKKKGFNDGEILIEVSDFVLAKYWEAGHTDICIYGLSTFVCCGGFPDQTETWNCSKRCQNVKSRTRTHPQRLLILFKILLLSGDNATNAGPIRYPCGTCAKTVRLNQHALICVGCDTWNHRVCLHMSKDE